jgi:drug/metabolite transporter (DMT)-like permease
MPKSDNGNRFSTADLLMILTTLIWAVNLSAIKFSLRELPGNQYNGIRLPLAGLLFLGVLALSGEGFKVDKKDLWKIAGLGALGTTLYQLLFIRGISLTPASTTAMIAPMTPVFIALLSHFLKLERIHWAAWIGIGVSFLGFYVLLSAQNGGAHFSGDALKGGFFVLAANFIWALYTVLSKPLLGRIPALKLAVLTTSFGALFFLPFGVPAVLKVNWAGVSAATWGAVAYATVLAIVFGFFAYYKAVQKLGNTKTGIYSNLNPVFATLFACLVLGEKLTVPLLAGGAVIFLGLYLTRSGYRLFPAGRDRAIEFFRR